MRVRCEDGSILWLTLRAADPLSLVAEAVSAHRGGSAAGAFALRVPFPPVEYATPEQLATTLRRARLVPRGSLLVLPESARGIVRQSSAAERRLAQARAAQAAAAMGPDDDGMQVAMQQMLQQMANLPNGAAGGGEGGAADELGGGDGPSGAGGAPVGGAGTAAGMAALLGGAPPAMNYEALLEMEETLGGAVAHGLSPLELATLPTRTLDAAAASDAELARCCICCCEFVSGDTLMRLHCKHEFHPECIGTWLRAKRTCPICKQSAVTEKVSAE